MEVKATKLTINDLYQAKKYMEIYDAEFCLLFTTEDIPARIIKICDEYNIHYKSSPDKMPEKSSEKITIAKCNKEVNLLSRATDIDSEWDYKIEVKNWYPHPLFERVEWFKI